jgi:LPPG:FO 2-phospho-L-lactate transferase
MALKVVAFAGGVGGAKLTSGLAEILPDEQLISVINTGDDFEHFGLTICPDLDTVAYTLAGLANPETGWGRWDETWSFLSTLDDLGGPTWFRLGDRDLALHHERTRRLKSGQTLSEVCDQLYQQLGVQAKLLPMSDQPVRTIVLTDEGELSFQEYFVIRGCQPQVKGFRFDGIEVARPAPGVREAISLADLIVFCPSNPWVSLDPILSLAGIRDTVSTKSVIGVSPIIGGKTIKGPAAKMFSELGIEPSPLSVAEHYHDLLLGIVIDHEDEMLREEIQRLGIFVKVTNTIMRTQSDRLRLAEEVVAFASEIPTRKGRQ